MSWNIVFNEVVMINDTPSTDAFDLSDVSHDKQQKVSARGEESI
jgi:hypothetical protein